MNFLLLAIQSVVCVACVAAVKKAGIISFRAFDMQDAKAWFPISFLLVSVIYTGSKSLVSGILLLVSTGFNVFLAILEHTSVHDIQELDNHSNCVFTSRVSSSHSGLLTIHLSKAYGEVIWFGGRVTGLTFISFIFMVWCPGCPLIFSI
jgi:GDP-mannose transporter